MQAIARVNRVCKGKEGGLVVDYIGIAGALKRAMKDYTSRDQHNYGDMNIAETAYPKFLEKLDVCRDLMYGFNYRKLIFQNSREALADAIAEGTDWLLDPERHEDTESFLKQCQLMNQALSLCKSMVSEEDAHEAAYLSVLRVQVLRLTGRGSGGGSGMTYTEFNKQVSEILQQSVHADGVLNLFEKDSVEISLFDEAFLQEVAGMKEKNIAIESLKRLIKEKVRAYGRTSVVKSQKFSEMRRRAEARLERRGDGVLRRNHPAAGGQRLLRQRPARLDSPRADRCDAEQRHDRLAEEGKRQSRHAACHQTFAAQIQVSARRCRGRHEDRHGTVRAVGRHQDQRIGRAGG